MIAAAALVVILAGVLYSKRKMAAIDTPAPDAVPAGIDG